MNRKRAGVKPPVTITEVQNVADNSPTMTDKGLLSANHNSVYYLPHIPSGLIPICPTNMIKLSWLLVGSGRRLFQGPGARRV